MIKNVITFPGTGTDIIEEIFKKLHVNLEYIFSLKDLENSNPDGLLLLGGRDINPAYYGERNRHSQTPDRERDQIEWYMIRQAMTKKIPIFGICRGCQMINVAFGGSLHQDIVKDRIVRRHVGPHLVNTYGKLDQIMPTDTVNSLHHQAIRTIPDGFKVWAQTGDHIIEAIYKPGVLGVQWHPELLYDHNKGWGDLFEWFVTGLV